MRVTTISTAALCSLGVLAAYGISNKVAGTPQPESPQEEPVAKPSVAPKPAVKAAIAQTIAPPETIASPSLATTRDLAKERQQREVKLAQDLAKVSIPNVNQPVVKPIPLSEINVPDLNHLPVDRIVAQSVKTATPSIKASTHTSIAAQAHIEQASVRPVSHGATPVATQTVANPTFSASQSSVSEDTNRLTAIIPSGAAPATIHSQTQHQFNTETKIEANTGVETTAPIATTQISSASETSPIARLQPPSAQPQAQPSQNQAILSAVEAITGQPNIQLVAQTVVQTIAQSVSQPNQPTNQPASQANNQPISTTISPPTNILTQQQSIQAIAQPQQQIQIAQSTSTGFSAISAISVDETYTLGAGDQISLRFFNTPEYNGEVQVQADGSLNLPVVGSFSVAGMTLKQAEAEIAARYQSEVRYAVVTVSLVQARPLQVAIVGEVQQPGSYVLSLVEGAQFPSVVRAIQAAGGTTQAADLRNVQVQRSSHSNPGQTIAVNLVDLLQSGNLSQDLKLRDGDRIIIPTAATVNFAEATQFAASNFAASPSQSFDIAIVGEVFRPGAYKIGGEGGRATVTQAIQLAGGVKPSANVRQIQIRRPTRSGAEQVINIDFWQLLQAGNLNQDLMLQQGDRIAIPTATTPTATETTLLTAANISPESISISVVGEVKSPGSVSVPASSTLNQAILAAGGLNNRATREIELIRLEPNGTLSRRTIKVDLEQGFNTTENPLLLSNDIVVVGRSGLTQFSDQFNQINSVIGPLLQLIPFRPF